MFRGGPLFETAPTSDRRCHFFRSSHVRSPLLDKRVLGQRLCVMRGREVLYRAGGVRLLGLGAKLERLCRAHEELGDEVGIFKVLAEVVG